MTSVSIVFGCRNLQSRFSLAGQGSMRIDSVNEGDTGIYTCRATNMEDSVDADVTLTVNGGWNVTNTNTFKFNVTVSTEKR